MHSSAVNHNVNFGILFGKCMHRKNYADTVCRYVKCLSRKTHYFFAFIHIICTIILAGYSEIFPVLLIFKPLRCFKNYYNIPW